MQPEPGDESVKVTRCDVTVAAREVGIKPGDTVMFHSSLSSMGAVIGGPDTVIEGFLYAVGPAGTVAVPTLCRWAPEEQPRAFDLWSPVTSPSYVGAISEAFRKRPDAVRSDNATHSVAAVGAKAEELTRNHGGDGLRPGPFGPRAFARESPWQRFYQWDAAYCFIGVNFTVNTMVHFVETLLVGRALARAKPAIRGRAEQALRGWLKPGVWPQVEIKDRELYEEMLARKGLVKYSNLGSATLRCARARTMVDRWLALLEQDPQRWLPADFLQWLKRLQGASNDASQAEPR